MPNAGRRQTIATPLIQISWTTKAKGRTKTAVLTLGSPFLAILLLVGSRSPHFEQVKRAARSILAAVGAGP
jgi:hypothetical protein